MNVSASAALPTVPTPSLPPLPGPPDDLLAASMSVPPAADFVPRLAAVLRAALDQHGWRFSCERSEFTSEEVSAPDGLLSMWIHRAQGIMAKSLGGRAGSMAYRLDGGSLCGVRPDPQGPTASLPTWLCYVHFALEEWRDLHPDLVAKNEPVPMDTLYQDWYAVVRERRIPLLPAQLETMPGLPAIPMPVGLADGR